MIISTDRLYLRELTIADAIHFLNINNIPDCIEFTGDKPFESLKAARGFLKNYVERYRIHDMGRWAVCLKENNAFLGWCGLKYHEHNKLVDLGYRFYKKYWGNGYATEAAKACVEYGFTELKLERIVAHVHIDNVASHQVAIKSGLKYKKDIVYDEQPAKFYEINKNEYLSK